jgi:hypothetical protein
MIAVNCERKIEIAAEVKRHFIIGQIVIFFADSCAKKYVFFASVFAIMLENQGFSNKRRKTLKPGLNHTLFGITVKL